MRAGVTVDDVLAWADDRLVAAGTPRTGDATVAADQPWGRVLRLPTAGGPVWLKQPAPAMRFELDVLRLLAGVELGVTPEVVAADPVRGAVLLADAGRTFSDAYDDATCATRFAAVLVEVGQLQRAAVPLVDELVAAGTPDLRPALAVRRFDELVAELGETPEGAGAARTALAAAAARLDRSAVPASIEHNDLHDGNVLLGTGGRVTVIDWGDSVVTHPFAVLLVAERVLASLLGDAAPDHPVITRARRDYLAVFADLAPDEDLGATADLAVLVAHLGRAWAWQRALAAFAATGRDAGPYADAARQWLALGVQALTAG